MDSGNLTPGLRSPSFTPNSISLSRDLLQGPAPGKSDPLHGPLKPGACSGARRPGQAWAGGEKTRSPGQLVGVWTASPEEWAGRGVSRRLQHGIWRPLPTPGISHALDFLSFSLLGPGPVS